LSLEGLWRGIAVIYVLNDELAGSIVGILKSLGIATVALKYSLEHLRASWECYDALIMVMPASAAIRLLCPLIKDKFSDKPVVVVREDGKYVVPILGAHWGANDLARALSERLHAEPVITTTSESLGVTSIEELARRLITKIVNPELLARANAELLRGGCISVIGIDSLPGWLKGDYRLSGECRYRIVITDEEPQREFSDGGSIYLRKLRLSIGVGLRRGVNSALVREAILETLRRLGVGIDRVDVIVSVDESVRKVAEDLGVRFLLIPREVIKELKPANECLTPPSDTLLKLGFAGVAEPLALIAGGPMAKLIMRKIAYANSVTIAVAAHE